MFSSAMQGRRYLRRFSSIVTTQSPKSAGRSGRSNFVRGCRSSSSGSSLHNRGKYSIWRAKRNIEGNQRGKSVVTRLYSASLFSQNSTSQETSNDDNEDDDEGLNNSHHEYSFHSDFYTPNAKDYLSVKPGGYTDIDKDEIEKFFPEGLSEGSLKEFDFTGRSTWMIRDTSKLLCGLVDTYENKKGLPQAKKRTTARFGDSAEIEGLTSRKEWENAVLRVFHNGTDLINVNPSTNPRKPAPVVVREDIDHVKVLENCLDQILSMEHFPDKILLSGDRGTGKSIALSQMVYHARRRGWICFFVPNGWDQVHDGSYVEPVKTSKGELKFDNVFMSADVLRGFYKAHCKELRNIPINDRNVLEKYKKSIEKFEESWQQAASLPGRENNNFLQMRAVIEDEDNFEVEDAKDKAILQDYSFINRKLDTLEDLALLGIALRDLSGSIIMDLVEELKNLDLPDHPVLLAVDQVNTWHASTAFYYENQPVAAQDICVPHAFNFLSKKKAIIDDFKIKNGFCIGAVSFKHNEGNRIHFIDAKNSIPLLIKAPTYNQVEFLSSVLYYMAHGRMNSNIEVNQLLALRTFVASNPRLLREEALSFLLPIEEDENFDENLIDPRDGELIDLSSIEGKGFCHQLNQEDEKLFEYAGGHVDK